ncbi:hypothetical protein GCM10010442_56750 [Kitasatospora kifunensis]
MSREPRFSRLMHVRAVPRTPSVIMIPDREHTPGRLPAERTVAGGAECGHSGEDRVNQRNGYRRRGWDTRVAAIDCHRSHRAMPGILLPSSVSAAHVVVAETTVGSSGHVRTSMAGAVRREYPRL